MYIRISWIPHVNVCIGEKRCFIADKLIKISHVYVYHAWYGNTFVYFVPFYLIGFVKPFIGILPGLNSSLGGNI